MQKLAEDGVLFRQAFCCAPTCSPSRASLVTGEYAHCNGMTGLSHRGFRLKNYSHHILHTLRKAGYTSVLAGIQHIAHGPEAPRRIIGYDLDIGPHNVAHERASEFLSDSPPQPFFLSVGFGETHRAFPPIDPGVNPDYCIPPLPFADTPETRKDMMSFKKIVRTLDSKIGMVLNALDQNGLAENTLVICTTDHGIAFPRMKCNLTDGGIGVMLIMRGPDGFNGGKVVDGLVSQIDLFPTLCDMLGIERPGWLQGVSILPLINGQADDVRDEIFAEVNYHAAYEPQRCVRTKRWKYIRRFDKRLKPALVNCDDSPSKLLWINNGWMDTVLPESALYDLMFDPGETNNLVSDKAHKQILEDMQERLERWTRETDDPLLKGQVPAPENARLNDPDDISTQQQK